MIRDQIRTTSSTTTCVVCIVNSSGNYCCARFDSCPAAQPVVLHPAAAFSLLANQSDLIFTALQSERSKQETFRLSSIIDYWTTVFRLFLTS